MEKQQQQNRSINYRKNILDIFIGHIKIHALSAYKGNSELEILLVKTFSLEKNTKSNNSSYYRKNQVFILQENSLWSLQH